jgi:predicted GNAT family N-acyltransferase
MLNSFEIKVANQEEIQDALKIRERVFINEVGVARNLELDDNDYAGTTHILSRVNGESVGTLRLRYFAGFSKIERVCVLPEYRKTNIASQMINYAIQISQAKGYSAVRAICDERLLPFWKEQENFELIQGLEKLALHGHTFCEIYKKLDPIPDFNLRTSSSLLNIQDKDILGLQRFR